MKGIAKHIYRNDLVGKKIRILAETKKLESGLSSNIFKCGQIKARSYITTTWLTQLSDSLLPFVISMVIQMLLPESPTIMDIAIETHLSISQLQSLNRTRLYKIMMYFGKKKYTNVDWPKRKCKQADLEMYNSFTQNLPSTKLQRRELSLKKNLKLLTNEVKIPTRRSRSLTIAYDGFFDDTTISESVSIFHGFEESHFDSNVVHGNPASSTRAELFGVIIALRFAIQILQHQKYDEVEFSETSEHPFLSSINLTKFRSAETTIFITKLNHFARLSL